MLGGGGMAEQEASAVTGGGGIGEHEASAVFGGGGTAEQEESAVLGGGGIAEHEADAVAGGGGIAEHEASAVAGGGGIAEQEASEVRGGGGIAEQVTAVLGGGGITDPERAGLRAPATPLAPDSILSMVRRHPFIPQAPFSGVRRPSPHPPGCVPSGCWSRTYGSSDVQTTTRVRSPRNRSLANSSGSPERA
jgi:hypothetical protein